MSPFGYAVCLVNYDPCKLLLPVNEPKSLTKSFRGAELGCDIQEASSWVARLEVSMYGVLLLIGRVAIQGTSLDPQRP